MVKKIAIIGKTSSKINAPFLNSEVTNMTKGVDWETNQLRIETEHRLVKE